MSCDDGDPCTENDVQTIDDCNGGAICIPCAGTALVDSDNDGTCDAEDGCPLDPNKTAPGNCGCGFDEVNTTPTFTPIDQDPVCTSDGIIDLASLASPTGGTFSGPGVSGSIFDPANAGVGSHSLTYSLTFGDCTTDASITVNVDICTGVKLSSLDYLNIYPNPSRDIFNISYSMKDNADISISLYDVQSKQLRVLHEGKASLGSHQLTFDASNLAAGTYFVKFQAGNDALMRKIQVLK